MTSERWEKVQTVFEAVIERPDRDRLTYLRELCAGDENLYGEVSSLLDADEHVHKLLHGLAIDAVGLSYERQYIGKRIGPYRIIKHIGSGGMSHVFLAEREDGQFQQRVALKLIKHGMESEQILLRFRSERQILSRLDHPNIARILDGGMTDDGVPYFTMDYVDGTPIDRYCNENRLAIDERLELFGEICNAVQYAHGNLVVHRDLKPGNIYVTKNGTVKLLDFGIAKVLGEGEEDALLTRTGLRAMTPEYASPEQIRVQPVTTATDVYALGIVLYELLTGFRPYTIIDRSPSEMERIICTEQPERPSIKISKYITGNGSHVRQAIPPDDHAAHRNTSAARLRNTLRGDLDTICLTTLRKEPERRYRSAEQLLRDVQRYQEKLPISARQDTVGYRLDRFIRRHSEGVIAATLVLLLVSSLIVYYTGRLTDKRNAARLEAAKSEEISNFLSGLFSISNPSEGRGESVTARELLDQGARRARIELAAQPEVMATMMDVIGTVYHSLGLYTDARLLLQDALDTRIRIHGESHPLVASSMNNLALTEQDLGDFAGAEERITRALEIQRSHYKSVHEDIASSLSNLAEVRRMRGDLESAQQLFTESYEMHRSLYGYNHPSVANVLHSLAVLRNDAGDYEAAERNYTEALTILENTYGEYHPDVGNVLNNLASLYRHRGEYDKAEPLYLRALDVRQRVLNVDHPDLAYTYNHMGRLYQFTRRYTEAEQSFLEGLRIRDKVFGKNHPVTTASMSALANLYEATEQYERAESLYTETYEIMVIVWGEDHHYIGAALNNIGRVQYTLGKYDAAERNLLRSIEQHNRTLPEGHVTRANSLLSIGNLFNDTGRPDEAEKYLLAALELREKNLPAGHFQIAAVRVAMGTSFMKRGKYRQAEKLVRGAYETFSIQFGEDDRRTRQAAERLAELERLMGKNNHEQL